MKFKFKIKLTSQEWNTMNLIRHKLRTNSLPHLSVVERATVPRDDPYLDGLDNKEDVRVLEVFPRPRLDPPKLDNPSK